MKKLFGIIIIMFFLMGCAGMRQTALQLSQEDLKNAETVRKLSKNLLEVWGLKSGFIREWLGDQATQEITNIMDKLDKSYEQFLVNKKELLDKELGQTIALNIKLLLEHPITNEALQRIAPDIVDILMLSL